MICVLSPAKAMDLSGGPDFGVMSQPVMEDTAELLEVCKKFKPSDLMKLMNISEAIATKDHERYRMWEKNACKAACLAMDGPAYRGFDGHSLSSKDRMVAQDMVRILSGLYGVLKPFDAIRPYRLEMGSKVKTKRGSTLYDFWSGTIAKEVAKGANFVVNAASQEYWKSVRESELGVPVLTIDFPGPAVYAKKARGLICRYAVLNQCQIPEELKGFSGTPSDPYVFDPRISTDKKYVFMRLTQGGGDSKPMASLKEGNVKKRPASDESNKDKKKAR